MPLSYGNDGIELIEMTGEDGPIATTTAKYRMLSPDVCWKSPTAGLFVYISCNVTRTVILHNMLYTYCLPTHIK